MSDSCLIIFIKNPELGKVKTRLAKTMGDKAALDIYKKLLKHTHDVTVDLSCHKKLYFSDHIQKLEGWSEHFESKFQSAGDLGYKMKSAFESELIQYKKVCIIGSDCAELTIEIIEAAFDQLDHHDVILGPANDGGYYLLGLKKMELSIFENITWSSDQVLKETLRKLKAVNKSYSLLPELVDVDIEDDWEKVKAGF